MSTHLKGQKLKWYLKYKLFTNFKLNLKTLRFFQSKLGFEKITTKSEINNNFERFKVLTD